MGPTRLVFAYADAPPFHDLYSCILPHFLCRDFGGVGAVNPFEQYFSLSTLVNTSYQSIRCQMLPQFLRSSYKAYKVRISGSPLPSSMSLSQHMAIAGRYKLRSDLASCDCKTMRLFYQLSRHFGRN